MDLSIYALVGNKVDITTTDVENKTDGTTTDNTKTTGTTADDEATSTTTGDTIVKTMLIFVVAFFGVVKILKLKKRIK